ncbi:hypothetical protein G6F68_013022 [Rhizopus microsporus]|nr:hypothetical protein G6F68_013022 [Rhizopus microsporus]KAG1386901.1 hypothetical protein G6F59_016638 [Rhizopus arrhizus]
MLERSCANCRRSRGDHQDHAGQCIAEKQASKSPHYSSFAGVPGRILDDGSARRIHARDSAATHQRNNADRWPRYRRAMLCSLNRATQKSTKLRSLGVSWRSRGYSRWIQVDTGSNIGSTSTRSPRASAAESIS